MGSLLFALFLGIGVAYLILASQFNSFKHPITIITILPLSIAGAAFALSLVVVQAFYIIADKIGLKKKRSEVLLETGPTSVRTAKRGQHPAPQAPALDKSKTS
jgi:ABC-type Fe3+ transport system permease subunit